MGRPAYGVVLLYSHNWRMYKSARPVLLLCLFTSHTTQHAWIIIIAYNIHV